MPWVPKRPKPYDFCGHPPCPLCFDFVEGNRQRIKGENKFIQDMFGIQPAKGVVLLQTLDRGVAEQVRQEMAKIHNGVYRPTPDAEAPTPDQLKHTKMQVEYGLKLAAKAKAAPPPRKLNTVVLDNIPQKVNVNRDTMEFESAPKQVTLSDGLLRNDPKVFRDQYPGETADLYFVRRKKWLMRRKIEQQIIKPPPWYNQDYLWIEDSKKIFPGPNEAQVREKITQKKAEEMIIQQMAEALKGVKK